MDRNLLYEGDNLQVLKSLESASVDLVYIDPPFNKLRSFGGYSGKDRRYVFFNDDFRQVEITSADLEALPAGLRVYVIALQEIAKPGVAEYVAYIGLRLLELRRILKDTGSIYVHCDETTNYQIRQLLDVIFGETNFRNELIWHKNRSKNQSNTYGRIHETIFYFSKTASFTTNKQYTPYTQQVIDERFRHKDAKGSYALDSLQSHAKRTEKDYLTWRGYNPRNSGLGAKWAVPSYKIIEAIGKEKVSQMTQAQKLDWLYDNGYIKFSKNGTPSYKRYLSEAKGNPLQSVWNDIGLPPIEYPTQKPDALLRRIIQTSSNAGDVVLDCFCGSGTTLQAAQDIGRKWIGIDKNPDAIEIVKKRITADIFSSKIKFVRIK